MLAFAFLQHQLSSGMSMANSSGNQFFCLLCKIRIRFEFAADSMLCVQLSSGMPTPDTVESLQESSILLKNLTQTLEYQTTGILECFSRRLLFSGTSSTNCLPI